MFNNKIHTRIKIILLVIIVCFILIIGKVFYIQVIDYKNYKIKAQKQRAGQNFAVRGDIYDRNGFKLATDDVFYNVFARRADYDEDKSSPDAIATALAPILNISKAELLKKLNSTDQIIAVKKDVDRNTAKKIAGIDFDVPSTIPSPIQTEYRCKIQYPLQQTKVSKRILAGYYKKNSHELVNIKFCPVHPDIINKITEFFRERAVEFEAYNEKTRKGLLRHIVFKYSKINNEMLIVLCINDDKISPKLKALCEDIYNTFGGVKGVCVNFNTMNNNVIMSDNNIILL
mgnify:CR=1 FL=1